MNYEYIKYKILDVLTECKIYSFPIDCFQLLEHYGYRIFKYNEIRKKNPDLYKLCMHYTEDAFHYRTSKIVAYDETKSVYRIRFSLMHELGHIILEHNNGAPQEEQEANFFSSNILAPRMVIHYGNCKNRSDVSELFKISEEAADIAYNDYKRRYRYYASQKMAKTLDIITYDHFYNKKEQQFIYQISACECCGKTIYNTKDTLCDSCFTANEVPLRYENFKLERDFLVAEHNWLYGE